MPHAVAALEMEKSLTPPCTHPSTSLRLDAGYTNWGLSFRRVCTVVHNEHVSESRKDSDPLILTPSSHGQYCLRQNSLTLQQCRGKS